MTTDNKDIIHFETVWNKAEELVLKQYKEATTKSVIEEILQLFADYTKTDTIEQEEIKSVLRKRYLGEILYLISFLSARDAINVYAELKMQNIINDLG